MGARRRLKSTYFILPFLAGIGFIPCRADPRFVDVTSSRGLAFTGTYGPTFSSLVFEEALMQKNMGNGAAVGDYDGDGDLDIYLLGQLGQPNRLFRNDLDTGQKRFTDVTAQAGVGDLGESRVAHFVDLDNDGRLDLLLVNDDDGSGAYPPSTIYRNNGDGTFTDVTAGSGFRPVGFLRCGAALADYDRDGLVDVYVTNWGMEMGTGTANFPGSNRLYRNLGNFKFQDVTLAAGLGTLARDSFSAIFFDFNDDLYPDLFVAVDHTSDEFYWNTAGRFSNATLAVGATHTGNDMGLACSDFDNDGDLDVYATNITDPSGVFGTTRYNALNLNASGATGVTHFSDQASAFGLQDTYWGWGVKFTDVDNDGDLDVVAVTGFDDYVGRVAGASSPIYHTPPVLLLQQPAGTFVRQTGAGLDDPGDSRALIAFDYDRDGDEDLLITGVNQPVRLLENQSGPQGHWLHVELRQAPGSNRFGIGASVYATTGGVTLRRDIIAGDSYLAGTPAEVHFGLGNTGIVDRLRVRWTDGSESVFDQVAADRFVRVTQNVADADLDGVPDADDCSPGDPATWALPSPVATLTLSGPSGSLLDWSAPVSPGGTAPLYDVLRSTSPADLSGATCVESNGADRTASDTVLPSGLFAYLIRVKNVCGSNLGTGPDGSPRVAPACL